MWQRLEDKEITLPEARVHIAAARYGLDSLKVEIAMAHLQQTVIGPVAFTGKGVPMVLTGTKPQESRKQ